ncbi:MAG: lactonase family protein [Bacteroidota bacterium]
MVETTQGQKSYPFYLGTYTHGESEGIYRYLLLEDGSLKRTALVASTTNPSYLAHSADRRFLLVASEVNDDGVGFIESYAVSGDSLTFINKSSSGGAHPCFLVAHPEGYVFTANYTGGNIGLLRLGENGNLSGVLHVQQHSGGSGVKEQQNSPHAHSVWFEPNDNKNIISLDLGTDELWFSQLDSEQDKLVPSDPKTLKMAPGAGPRHLIFHPNGMWAYVLNELDGTITTIQKNTRGNYEKKGTVSTLPPDYAELNSNADIHISSDGKFVYASNRGHNSIAIYSVDSTNGSIVFIGHESTRGETPRNFSLSPDENYVLVANQHSNSITSFKRNKNTGLLTFVSQIEAPAPVCILF